MGIKYTLIINQFGITEQGLWKDTDTKDWIILDFLFNLFIMDKAKRIIIEGREMVWVNYPYLIESLPALKLKPQSAKRTIIRRIKKLRKLEFIKTYKAPDNTLYFRLTDHVNSVYCNQVESQHRKIRKWH
jgi:hypothetical protein